MIPLLYTAQQALITLTQVAQQAPVVVDLTKQPEPAADISIYTVLGMFAMAGVLLTVAAVGSILVGGGMFLYKRWKDRSDPSSGGLSHTRLRI
jgi:hypothetical protein